MSVLGIDVGGTKIAAARVRNGVEIEGATLVETRAAEGFDRSLAQLWLAIESTMDRSVEAIGIAAPGPLDPIAGVILNPPHLDGWRDVHLARMAQEKFGLPVRIENDCTAAALGEARFGAGRGHPVVFYAAAGTGVGSGIIIGGEIFHGAHGFAGEVESSVPGLAAARAALARDDADFVQRIGLWLAAIVDLLDPSIVVLGGGVLSDARSDSWFERWRELVREHAVNPCAARIPLVRPKFGAMAGVIGAAALFA